MTYLLIYLYISFSIFLLCQINKKNGKAVITLELKKWKKYIIEYIQIILLSLPFIVLSILMIMFIVTIFLLVVPIYFVLNLMYVGTKNIFKKLKGIK